MSERRYRVLVVASHPVQYGAPFFRSLASHPQADLQVAYCSLRGVQAGHDAEFARSVQWDVPLLDGYDWVQVRNLARGGNEESFFGLCNPGLWELTRKGSFDAVVSFVGYRRCSFWIALAGAKSAGVPFLFGTDAMSMIPRDPRPWMRSLKLAAKRAFWPLLFQMADQTLCASTPGRDMLQSLGIPAERISMTLITVDNDWWLAAAAQADREAVRKSWGAAPDDPVILFCAKLQPWKRPLDLLDGFVRADLPGALLVYAGEGSQRTELEMEIKRRGAGDRVRLLGFVNQSQLPGVYKAADLMVIPSEYEPFGLVVNEAMLCGCAVAASDHVGAIHDLILPNHSGFVFRCGDAEDLARCLREAIQDRAALRATACRARAQIADWSQHKSAAAVFGAVQAAVLRSQRSKQYSAANGESQGSAK